MLFLFWGLFIAKIIFIVVNHSATVINFDSTLIYFLGTVYKEHYSFYYVHQFHIRLKKCNLTLT